MERTVRLNSWLVSICVRYRLYVIKDNKKTCGVWIKDIHKTATKLAILIQGVLDSGQSRIRSIECRFFLPEQANWA